MYKNYTIEHPTVTVSRSHDPGFISTPLKDMSDILVSLEHSDINEKEVASLRSKMKEIEKKLKTKLKPKTITISSSDHDIIKSYCSYLKLNIGDWVSKTLLKEIKENSAIIYEEGTEEEILEKRMDEITKRYFDSKMIKSLVIKTDKLIVGSGFNFVGYCITDHKPIYECTRKLNGDESVATILEEAGIKFEVADARLITRDIFGNPEFEVEFVRNKNGECVTSKVIPFLNI